MTLNDAILAVTGGPTVNDGLRAYYLANGAVAGALPDLERQFLLANGGVSSSNQDMWMQILGATGYTGTLNDMLYRFWIDGGLATPLNPLELFANGEVGVYYDESDLSTLYQDSDGVTPVTVAGQPVGLMLDQSQGLVLGPEKLVSTTPTVATWNSTVDAVVTEGAATWTAAASGSAVDPSAVGGNIGVGTYRCELTIDSISAGALRLRDLSGTFTSREMTTVGTHSFYFYKPTGTSNLRLRCVGTTTAVVTNLTVKTLAGYPASQSDNAKLPILEESGGLYSLKFDGIDDELLTTFRGALGTDCTIGKAVNPASTVVGAQTIGTTYTMNADNYATVITNDALTIRETKQLTDWLDAKAGN